MIGADMVVGRMVDGAPQVRRAHAVNNIVRELPLPSTLHGRSIEQDKAPYDNVLILCYDHSSMHE
jgi:hypothetical protein